MPSPAAKPFLLLLLWGLVSINTVVWGQSNIHVQVLSLTARPGPEKNLALYRHQLDDGGKWLMEPGLMVSYEFYVRDLYLSLRVDQAGFRDVAGKMTGFTRFGIHARVFKKWRNALHLGFGPALYYRESWHELEGYQEDGTYTRSGNMQVNLCFLTGGLEYNRYLSRKLDLSVGLNHLYPNRVGLAVGVRYWFSTKIKTHYKCNTCPKF